MKKHIYTFKMNALASMQYRFDSIFGLIMGNLGIVVTIIFWIAIMLEGDGQLNNYDVSGIITYFVISALFMRLTLNGSGFELSGLIKGGGLSRFLLKPMSVPVHLYFKNLAQAGEGVLSQLILTLLVLPFVHMYISWKLTLFTGVLLLAYLVVATIISFNIWILFGKVAFWIQESTAVMYSFAVLMNFLTGMFIPLDFFPDWSQRVMELLPFSAFTFIPAKIFIGHYEPQKIVSMLSVHIMWILVLTLVNSIIWSRGIRRYSAVGG